jgi:hypothetical protein
VTAVAAGRGRGDQLHLIMQHSAGRSSTASVTLTAPTAIGTHVSVDGEAGREVLDAARRSFANGRRIDLAN